MPNSQSPSGPLEFAPDVQESQALDEHAMPEPLAAAKESSANDSSPEALPSTLWPWELMQQIQTKMQRTVDQPRHATSPKPLEKSL